MNRILASIAIPIIAFCYPFLNNYTPYIDDLNRGLTGAYAWSPDGRPFSDLIYWVLNFGGVATFIFPSITIIAISFLIFAIYMVCKENNLSLLYAAGFTTVIVNPFFTQPMLYKYDSLLMIISIALIFICFIKTNNRWIYLSIIPSLISIGMYQTSIAIYIAVSLIEAVYSKGVKANNDILTTLIKRALILLLSSILYIILLKFIGLSDYAQEHSKSILSGNVDLIKSNIVAFSSLFNSVTTSFSMLAILIASLAIAFFSVIYKIMTSGKKEAIYLSIIAIACPCVAMLSVFGVSILLLHPVFEPRVLTASFICIFFLIAATGEVLPLAIRYVAVIFLILLSLSTASAVNYSYSMSIKYNEIIYNSIRENTSPDKTYSLYFYGSPRKSPYVAKIESKIPMSERINFNYFHGGLFSDAAFNFNGINSYTKPQSEKPIEFTNCANKVENQIMSACVFDAKVLVEFK